MKALERGEGMDRGEFVLGDADVVGARTREDGKGG